MSDAIAVRQDGAIQQTTEGFGTNTMVRANETASVALAAQARAQIEARYIVAMRNPRDWDNVRLKMLKECSRPGFAQVARYSKPVGGSRVEGPSIRFVEAAIRCMGNIVPESVVIWDDEERRTVRVSVTDIESNVTYSTDVVIAKTVERSTLQKGQQALSSRTNSNGKITYTVRAIDEDMLNKQNAQVSKALRTQGQRLIPGDILAECMDRVMEVQRNSDAQDPDAARKKLLDAFGRLNIMPSQLAEYLGHDTSQIVPAELSELRAIFAAISEGETTWSGVLASKHPNEDGETTPAAQKAVEAVKARLQAKKGGPAANQQVVIDHATGEVKPA
jgi:hypothetical protein